jgi:hypothetical protein
MMKHIPCFCDLMTCEEFLDAVKLGSYNADDGTGYFATSTQMDTLLEVFTDKKPDWATHVAWFNK